MIYFAFPLVKDMMVFISEQEIQDNNLHVINDKDTDKQEHLTIPENWQDLSYNDKLDCVYTFQQKLNDLSNSLNTDSSHLIKFTVNHRIVVFLKPCSAHVQHVFQISFQNLYDDFMSLHLSQIRP